MIWIKSAGVAAVLAGLGVSGCSGTDKLLGSDGSTVSGPPPAAGSSSYVDILEASACLTTAFTWQGADDPHCQVSVVRPTACDCNGVGLGQSDVLSDPDVLAQLQQRGLCGNAGQTSCSDHCACSVAPAAGDALTQCRQGADAMTEVSAWCHVSTTDSDGDIPATCSVDTAQSLSLIRVIGYSAPQSGDLVVLQCSNVPAPAALGEPCVASDENFRSFPGFDVKEVNIEDRATTCQSNICVVNHFQGRASCPYGQAAGAANCLVPDGSATVTASVEPQLESRQANVASICSCQCDGEGPGPYCTCPDSMQCEHLVDDVGLDPPGVNLAGSYCIPKGSQYDPKAVTVDCVEPNCGPAHPN